MLLFSSGTIPTADGVAITSISGGGTGLLADLAAQVGLPVPPLQSRTVDELSTLLPRFATVANPLDVTGAAVEDPALMVGALAALQADPGIGLVVLALNVGGGSKGQEELYRDQAALLGKRAQDSGAPVLAISLVAGPLDSAIVGTLSEHGVIILNGAATSLKALATWMSWHQQGPLAPLVPRAVVDPVSLGNGSVVTGARAMQLLVSAGIQVPASYLAADLASLPGAMSHLSPPVVLKIESEGLAHKTEVGGVALGIDAEELVEAGRQMSIDVSRAAGQARIGDSSCNPRVTQFV